MPACSRLQANRHYLSQGPVIEQEQAQDDGQEIDPVMIAGEDDQQLPEDRDPGSGKAPAPGQEHHERHQYLDDQRGTGHIA